MKKPVVCIFGTYERKYPRNEIRAEALRRAGVEVVECHVPVWERERHKSVFCRGTGAVALAFRLFQAYWLLAWRYRKVPRHDAIVVGYVGQFDMPLAWLLGKARGIPVVFDPLVSLHDTFCCDRKLVRPGSLRGRLLWWADRVACLAADLIWLDTAEHAGYFARTFGVAPERIRVIPVGADDRVFRPRSAATEAGRPFEVLFVGKYIPLHGVETILRAAALLREHPIRFVLIGCGQQMALARRLIASLDLSAVTQVDWVEYERLPDYYAAADLCLGIFGDSAKASRVVSNKVYQALAMGKPVLTTDSPGLRGLLEPGTEVATCRVADPDDLARRILELADDPAAGAELARRGYEAFRGRFRPEALGDRMLASLGEWIPGLVATDRMAWGSAPEFFGPRHRFREGYLFEAIRKHLRGGTLIDAACGSGSLARRFAGAGYRVIGVDLSADFLRFISGRGDRARLELVRGDITRLALGEARVDGVVAGEVLEHLVHDDTAVREFWRVLRPGGVCAISVPADPTLWHWHDDWVGHVRRYRLEGLRGVLEAQGFEVVEIHYFGFPFVKFFHQYIYIPHLCRTRFAAAGARYSSRGRWKALAGSLFFLLFQLDRLFDSWDRGIGLIAVARKPAAAAVALGVPA